MISKETMAVLLMSLLLSPAGMTQDHEHHGHDHNEDAHQDHADHEGHHHNEPEAAAQASDTPAVSHATLTQTDEINAALAKGGEAIVADVMGVVCDFCALAMNKIFSKREEIAAVYVDLDTKALSLVLTPGATLSDETLAELAVQAGYRISAVRRGEQALGQAS